MSTRVGKSNRFLLFSHDGLGLGHTRRHIAVANALVELEPDACVLLASGADDISRTALAPQVEVLKLPGLRKIANNRYASRRLPLSPDETHALRSQLMLAAVETFRPDVMLVDRHPFGVGGELAEPIDALRAAGGRLVLGLRDILDSPAAVRREWAAAGLAERVLDYFDEVLVYGMLEIFDPVQACSFPTALLQRTQFCGYIVNRDLTSLPNGSLTSRRPRRVPRRPLVLGTAGGGEDGSALIETFVRAASKASWEGIAIAGPMTPEPELARLGELGSRCGVTVKSVVPSLSRLFAVADAVVCMGGYNTLTEALIQGLPAVCVPRTAPREEQAMRAAAFERLGLIRVLAPEALTPERLAEAAESALRISRRRLRARVHALLDFSGAANAARRLLTLAGASGHSRREEAAATA